MGHLVANSLGKTFGNFEALRDISFSVGKGECLVLFGASGAGKTTLLRLIAGLEKPSTGRLELEGQNLDGVAASARGVALLSQSVSLYPQLNVRRNMEAALKGKQIAGSSLARAERAQRIDAMLAGFGVEALAEKLPSQLSGGESQRVAFARALVAEPKLLLLDEPLSQLDGPNRESAIALLKEVAQRFRPTTIMVSHDPVDAMRLGDQVAVLDAGNLLDSGSPENVYRNPSCRASADLFGVWGMNWFETDPRVLPSEHGGKGRWMGFRPEAAEWLASAPELVATEGNKPFVLVDGRDGPALLLSGHVLNVGFVGSGYLCELLVDGTKIRILSARPAEGQGEGDGSSIRKTATIRVPLDQVSWVDG
ncbi:MAG: ABC transporter ATP-binding protein [Aureliella sp.]